MKNQMSAQEAWELKAALTAMLPTIKAFPLTTRKKSEHYWKLSELRKLHDSLGQLHFMYNPENSYTFEHYKKAVDCQEKKAILDTKLHYALEGLYKDVNRHIRELESMTDIQGVKL